MRVRALLLLCLAAACEQAPTLVRARSAVAVYAVLSANTQTSATDSAIYALVARQDGPFTGSYLTAESFAMQRIGDARPLAWQWTGREGELPQSAGNGFVPSDGNYRLMATAPVDSVTHWTLLPGDSVALTVTLGDRIVRGRTRLPLLPTPSIVVEGDSVVAYWPHDPHVGAYWIETDTESAFPRFQSDTSLRLRLDRDPWNRPAEPYIRVFALDSALARFVRDPLLRSAGLTGADGVFGAVSLDSVRVADSLFATLVAVDPSPDAGLLKARRQSAARLHRHPFDRNRPARLSHP